MYHIGTGGRMNRFVSLFHIRRLLECRYASTRIAADGKDVPRKKHYENRITLIAPDSTVSITDLRNAQNLSLRRELKLVKIQDEDSKTRRPVYKLMTNAEYHAEELERRKEKQTSRQNSLVKGEKLLTFSIKIGENDLLTRVNKIIKLLEKQYEVKVVITGDSEATAHTAERIFSLIEKNIKSVGKILQKRAKGNNLKFQLQPLQSNSSTSDRDTPDQNESNDKPL